MQGVPWQALSIDADDVHLTRGCPACICNSKSQPQPAENREALWDLHVVLFARGSTYAFPKWLQRLPRGSFWLFHTAHRVCSMTTKTKRNTPPSSRDARNLPAHNARFARPAAVAESAFVRIADPAALTETLCVQEDRVVDRANTVSWGRLKLQLPQSPLRAHF